MPRVRFALAVAATVCLLLLILLFWPTAPKLPAVSAPAQSYADALARFDTLQRLESDTILPECRTQLLTHGSTVTHTIVFFHGISSCPAQFTPLGRQFYDLGFNVLIPRLPHHGLADRMTTALQQLTAEELVTTAQTAVDIATGLGEEVTVAGFSTGGTLAAWVAMARPDVDQTVLLSPFLRPRGYAGPVVRPLTRALLWLPNRFWWWDETLQESIPGPPYAYPRYASHAIAQTMRLALAVRAQAARTPPQSDRLLVFMNAGPRESVDNRATAELVADWQRHGGNVVTYEFTAAMNIDHDYISVEAPHQPVDVVEEIYPLIIAQVQRLDAQE